MECRQRVITLWMPQGGRLGIGNHVEIQYRLNLLAGCRECGECTGLSTSEVSSSGGSERTFRGLRMKWCRGGASYDTPDCNNGLGDL
ncbi:hypothetical protein EVAR_31988_1 [Eumeta japonica]|uniref:Uncharacterized protein n=1 Tax=Eumeta variegata TaxID=151549 RepID=A0A4C1VT28_EUMVA|nr:hypothetical protein EVAR_31988_1 [Eumeta japonica]